MIRSRAAAPELMPELSPGRHRNPKRGACFMEFASYLAGEKWSDHPPCTSPLLAAAARMVNDFTSDQGRQRLVPLIPRVIGLRNDDERLNLRVVVHAASAAIPVAALERQRALAVGLLSCSRILGNRDAGLATEIEDALAQVPDCKRWAMKFAATHQLTADRATVRQSAEAMIRLSVVGIAFACVPDADDRLYNLLELVITDYEQAAPARPSTSSRAILPFADAATGQLAPTR